MCGFGHTMILIPSLLTKSLLGLPGSMIPILCTKYEEKTTGSLTAMQAGLINFHLHSKCYTVVTNLILIKNSFCRPHPREQIIVGCELIPLYNIVLSSLR